MAGVEATEASENREGKQGKDGKDGKAKREKDGQNGSKKRQEGGKDGEERSCEQEGMAVEDLDSKQEPKAQPETKSKFHLLQDSLFGHMLAEEAAASAAMARRRAMMLVDVLVERHGEGRLKRRWIFSSALISLFYLRYALPVYAAWGARHLERSMEASEFENLVGGPHSQVSFGVAVTVTLLYLTMLHCSRRLMETRLPVSRIIFETLVVYNMTQMLLNLYVFVHLIAEARALGFRYPWGNLFSYSKEGHRLGYYIWFHYHCCQLELLDTLFVVVRKKFRKITFLHVYLRMLNMWGWFFVCRYACGGDAYFPAAVNAGTRIVVYAFYSLSLLTQRGVPFFRKARVTSVQMLQLVLCFMHSIYCLYAFWGMNFSKSVLVLYVIVMLNGLVLYTDFHVQQEGKSKAAPEPSARKVSFAFDSSGWLYCYHFGVAYWLRQHLLPEDLTPEEADTQRFPTDLIFSGSSGGALAACALSVGLDPAQVFEMVLAKHAECRFNPFRMLPAAEDILRRCLPGNCGRSMTGRVRVVLTRVSWKYPFFTAEVVNQFPSREDVFHVLRATCHVPFVAGILPYRYDGNFYLDGLLWPQLLVPWKGAMDDYMVRVSACSMPSSDIKAPLPPPWWAILPPSVEALRGLFWMGYRDAGRWFTTSPRASFACLACRRPSDPPEDSDAAAVRRSSSDTDVAASLVKRRRVRGMSSSRSSASLEELADGAGEEEERSTAWTVARKLMLREPPEGMLPEVDLATGRSPHDYVAICQASIDLNKRRMVMVAAPLCILAAALLLGEGL
mmetsp:Transcript_12746/g.36149  ORF Transcript_12746/g.36149 Transcript_12746/m.36149 type:complete len:787 (+) Transcript_12746:58-2418(+)